jgi:hypothetical protein
VTAYKHALPVGERPFDLVDEHGLALRQPQVMVVDLLGEGEKRRPKQVRSEDVVIGVLLLVVGRERAAAASALISTVAPTACGRGPRR